jgi:hypothetical protein
MASILKVESIQNPSAGSPSIDIDSSGNITFTGAITKSGGTANGVLYLNGSGVETSGSALTFDGTNLSTTGNMLVGGAQNGTLTLYPTTGAWWHLKNNSGALQISTGATAGDAPQLSLTTAGNLYVYDQTSTSAGAGSAIWFGNSQGSFAYIKGSLVDGSGNTTGDMLFYTRQVNADANPTYRGRINSSGEWQLNNSGGFGVNATLSVDALGAGTPAAIFYSTSNSFTSNILQINGQRAASSAYYLQRMYSDNGGVEQFGVRGDGAVFARGYLGIGTLNTSYMLNIQPAAGDATLNMKGGGAYLTLDSTTIGYSSITGKDNGTQRWSIGQSGFGGMNGMQFFSGTNEAGRFDANRNLLIGGTNLVTSNSPERTVIANNGISWLNSSSASVKALRGKCWYQNYVGGGTTYSLVAQLPASNAGTLDYIHLRVITNNGWGAAGTCVFEVIMGNRNGFSYQYHVLRGTSGNTGIVCLQDGSGNTNVYARCNNAYDYIHVDVLSSNGCNAVYEQSWTTTAPTGTTVFDTGNTASYPPAYATDPSGYFLVGTTSSPSSSVQGVLLRGTATGPCDFSCGSQTTSTTQLRFFNGNGIIGSIVTNGSSTAYNTSSDYRLKNIEGPLTGYKDRIMALEPEQGTWRADGSLFRGFVAHKFALSYPSSVVGEKDAVDAEGKPIMQSMQASTSEVMADLIALVKDLVAENESLKARLDAAGL